MERMLPNRICPDSNCPNGAILVVDANSILFLVEGGIRRVRTLYPNLTNVSRLPHILEELSGYLDTMKGCCSLDGCLHISEPVLGEVSLENRREIERKGLSQLRQYSNTQRRQIHRLLQDHFLEPQVTSGDEVRAICSLFSDPAERLLDSDASLIVTACHLAANEDPVVVITSDPDFTTPLNLLVRKGTVTLGGGHSYPTTRIMGRHYFHFMRCLHDCCNLPSDVYEELGNTYLLSQIRRLPSLRPATARRVYAEVQETLKIHTTAVQYKCVVA